MHDQSLTDTTTVENLKLTPFYRLLVYQTLLNPDHGGTISPSGMNSPVDANSLLNVHLTRFAHSVFGIGPGRIQMIKLTYYSDPLDPGNVLKSPYLGL